MHQVWKHSTNLVDYYLVWPGFVNSQWSTVRQDSCYSALLYLLELSACLLAGGKAESEMFSTGYPREPYELVSVKVKDAETKSPILKMLFFSHLIIQMSFYIYE